MPRRLTKEDAIQRMQAVRPEYGFSEFVYVNSREKSFVTCGTHGRFLSAHDNIMSGHGCPACKSAGNSALCLLPSSIAIHRMK